MNGSALNKKLSFEILGQNISSTFDCSSYIASVAKLVSKKAMVSSVEFSSNSDFVSKKLPSSFA